MIRYRAEYHNNKTTMMGRPIKGELYESYRMYKKTVPNPVDRLVYLAIIGGFLKFFMIKVFEGFSVRLGSKLGIIAVKGRKAVPMINAEGEIKGIAPNWGKTKVIWQAAADEMGLDFQTYIATVPREQRPEMAYCFNEHSGGNIYTIYWYKARILVANKTYYNLTFSRGNKRQLSKLIFEGAEYDVSEVVTTMGRIDYNKFLENNIVDKTNTFYATGQNG